jgi:hypothetical protein
MKKRVFLCFALAVLAGGGVFAQTHFISAEVSLLGGGVRYEYVITPSITLGGYFYYNFLPTPFIDEEFSSSHSVTGFGIAGRWYPTGRKFFIELDLGYAAFWTEWKETYYYTSSSPYSSYSYSSSGYKSDTFGGFGITPGFGWTIDVGKTGGFFISPGIKIPITITSESADAGLGEGVFPSVVGFFGLGYAF